MPTRWESSPRCRAWSSSRFVSSAPPSAGTRSPRASTRSRRPPEDPHTARAFRRNASAGRGGEAGLDGGRRGGRRQRGGGAPAGRVEGVPRRIGRRRRGRHHPVGTGRRGERCLGGGAEEKGERKGGMGE